MSLEILYWYNNRALQSRKHDGDLESAKEEGWFRMKELVDPNRFTIVDETEGQLFSSSEQKTSERSG